MQWNCVWCAAYRRNQKDANGVLMMPMAVYAEELCKQCRDDAVHHFGLHFSSGVLES